MTTTAFARQHDALPDYAPQLAAMHVAHDAELTQMINSLPLERGMSVLDAACGDGFYARRLARRVSPSGFVIGLDNSEAYLQLARSTRSKSAGSIRYRLGSVYELPFTDQSFDFVWCGHSLQTLTQTHRALGEMKRVLHTNGRIGIVETDGVHQRILPWPVKIERVIHRAERLAFRERNGNTDRMYFPRSCTEILNDVGLRMIQYRTIPVDRFAPLKDADRDYLAKQLDALWNRIRDHLPQPARKAVASYVCPQGRRYLPATKNLVVTVLNSLVIAAHAREESESPKK